MGWLPGADSDEAGHAFQSEAGHLFRSEAGRGSDLMSATLRRAAAGRWDDVFLWLLGQADGSGMRRLRMLWTSVEVSSVNPGGEAFAVPLHQFPVTQELPAKG
jgi:hypothetical protein